MAKRKRACEVNEHNPREAALGKKAIGIHTSQGCGSVRRASETVTAEGKKERESVIKLYQRLGTWKLSKPDSQLLSWRRGRRAGTITLIFTQALRKRGFKEGLHALNGSWWESEAHCNRLITGNQKTGVEYLQFLLMIIRTRERAV